MGKNIIFYFSGTGNNLQVAKEIANALPDCDIHSMADLGYQLSGDYERIGFIYPTYFQGLPKRVEAFISQLDLRQNGNAYYFGITTFGALAGNALPQLVKCLKEKAITLNYGEKLMMVSNYVVMYDMSETVEEKIVTAMANLKSMRTCISNKENNKIARANPILNWYYKLQMQGVPNRDRYFNIATTCNGCGVCEQVCPVTNIELHDGKPQFSHHCEQCMACIQHCPKVAINYKQLTQKRRRYVNPKVSYKEMVEGAEYKKANV